MSVLKEAVVLPAMFLTVTLLGGLRVGPAIQFVPPPLIAVVLGVLLMAALVRAAVVVPGELVNHGRKPIENLSGSVVMLTLAAGSVQVFNLLTPERGLLHVLFGTFFLVQLLSTIAGSSDRRALLRSLLVLLGSAFVLRYILLESLYARTSGVLTRVIAALMEGVSLGAMQYDPNGPATGYLAFAALTLYLTAVFLLRSDRGSRATGAIVRQPAERHEVHGDLPAPGGERQSLERCVALEPGRDLLRFAENLGVQIFDLLTDRLSSLTRSLDVLRLFHAPADPSRDGRRPPDVSDADRLPSEEGARETGENGDSRLELGLRGLLLFPFH
jgi:hypothetical protein